MGYLGIDLGTSSVKVVLLDVDGRLIAHSSAPYEISTRTRGWAEIDPELWWEAVATAVRSTAPAGTVSAIGLSGQMHGLVLCDRLGAPTYPAVLWPDTRSAELLARYRALPEGMRQRLGNPPATGMLGPSLLWLQAHEPEAYHDADHALSPKDWLRLRLSGEVASEPTDASATLLYDIPADDWHRDLATALGLADHLLPPLVATTAIAGSLTEEAATALGLETGTPIAAGAADAAASLVGTGLTRPGDVQIVVGTGMQVLAPRENAGSDATGRTHLFRACGPGCYALAAMQNAGVALEWVRTLIGSTWDQMYAQAFAAPPGCDGVVFLPYLTGERTPHLDPAATGGWLGLRAHHTSSHLARAAFEGVAFALADGVQALADTGIPAEQPTLAGGGSMDARWRQLIADVLRRPVRRCDGALASARGAALIAAVAVGHIGSLEEAAALAEAPVADSEPGPEAEALSEARTRFREAYSGPSGS